MSRVSDSNVNRTLNIKTCDVCNKKVAYAETRLAELPSIKQEGASEEDVMMCKTYQAIGIRFVHFDESVCDKTLYELTEI